LTTKLHVPANGWQACPAGKQDSVVGSRELRTNLAISRSIRQVVTLTLTIGFFYESPFRCQRPCRRPLDRRVRPTSSRSRAPMGLAVLHDGFRGARSQTGAALSIDRTRSCS